MAGELLAERFKIINIYLSAEVLGCTLVIYDVAATVLGISLPPFFTPTVLAIGTDSGDSVHVNVEIGFKPFGRIINYQGMVKVVPMKTWNSDFVNCLKIALPIYLAFQCK